MAQCLEKKQAIIIVQSWFRVLLKNETISVDDIIKIIINYYYAVEIMRFSTEYISKYGWKLFDDNKCIKRVNVPNDIYEIHSDNAKRWVLGDIKDI